MNLAWLLLLALPEDPAIALEALGRFGPTPECELQDLFHPFSPPPPIPAFEGIHAEVAPYLEHTHRAVVLRAAALVCRAGDASAAGRLVSVARRWPCENALIRMAAAVSTELNLPECKARADRPWRADEKQIAKWRKPNQRAVAKAISAGDVTALARTLWNLDALDASRAEAALATLAQLDDAQAFLPTFHALARTLGDELDRSLPFLKEGLFASQLTAIAARTSRADAFCRVAGRAASADRETLSKLKDMFDRVELEKAADRARRDPALTAFGRAYLEDLANAAHDWMKGRSQLRTLEDNRDRPALRAWIADDAHLMTDRLEAASVLARLGDGSGLVLFQSAEGLWPDLFDRRRQTLVELAAQASPTIRAEAVALLSKAWTR